jgi:hypothetical protein
MSAPLLKKAIPLWNNYHSWLPIYEDEFDKYIHIIIKLRNDDLDFSMKESQDFAKLVEMLAETIYVTTNCADKEDNDDDCYYRTTKTYEEPELNDCTCILNYLLQSIVDQMEIT